MCMNYETLWPLVVFKWSYAYGMLITMRSLDSVDWIDLQWIVGVCRNTDKLHSSNQKGDIATCVY